MSWMDQVAGILKTYGGDQPEQPDEVAGHFDKVAQAAPPSDLAGALASAFRSEQTPPFAQMVSQLFGQSNNQQRAGLLNTLLGNAGGAGILAQLASAAGFSLPGGSSPQITPEIAGKVSPNMVQEAAAHAEKHDPGIIDQVSSIYAQHPALFNTLGTAALSMAMSHLANRRRS